MVHVSPVSRTFEQDLNANFQASEEHINALEKSTNDRFHQNDIRWEKSDAEFLLLRSDIKRLDEKIGMLMWAMGISFVVLSTLITVFGIINH